MPGLGIGHPLFETCWVPGCIFFSLVKDVWIMDEDEFAGKTHGEKERF